MRIEGKITKMNDTDEVLARFGNPVPIGSDVLDQRNKKIGKTTWILGPVKNPYVEIKLNGDQRGHFSMLDNKIYIEVENNG